MPLWVFMLLLLGLIKLPIAALMLWLPFHNDPAAAPPPDTSDSSDDDGGSRTLPGDPRNPNPRLPTSPFGGGCDGRPARRAAPARIPRHRDPHGAPVPSSPRRIRTPAVKNTRPEHFHI